MRRLPDLKRTGKQKPDAKVVARPDRSVAEMTATVQQFMKLARVIHPTAAVVILKTTEGRKLKLRLS